MKNRTWWLGILSTIASPALGIVTYLGLTRTSSDLEADFVFRLVTTSVSMAIPFLATLVSFLMDRRRAALGWHAKTGLLIAILSLGLLWFPLRGLDARIQQAANQALDRIPAPELQTIDLDGRHYRLSDYRGRVVLLNVWATWCLPCRAEMPMLDRLYRQRVQDGLMVFGLSGETPEKQRAFAEQTPVSYPLLTTSGEIPGLFRDIARYPANFLVDRQGFLRRAPGPDDPFEALERVVDRLLAETP